MFTAFLLFYYPVNLVKSCFTEIFSVFLTLTEFDTVEPLFTDLNWISSCVVTFFWPIVTDLVAPGGTVPADASADLLGFVDHLHGRSGNAAARSLGRLAPPGPGSAAATASAAAAAPWPLPTATAAATTATATQGGRSHALGPAAAGIAGWPMLHFFVRD